MLSEKEMLEYFDAFALDMGDGVNGTDYSISERMFKEFARAIAEKMREGMVARIDGRWTTDDLGYHVLTVESSSNWADKKIRLATVKRGQLDEYYGQRVTVTLKEAKDV